MAAFCLMGSRGGDSYGCKKKKEENNPAAHMIYDLNKHYPEEFMASIGHFMSYLIMLILQIIPPFRG